MKTETTPRTAHDLLPGETLPHYDKPVSSYNQQAADFLTGNGLKFRATLSDTKAPAWGDDGKHGHHFRVTLSKGKPCTADYTGNIRSSARLTFDF